MRKISHLTDHLVMLTCIMVLSGARRFEEIDSLRGIAAAVVVLNHCVLLWGTASLPESFAFALKTPIGVLFDGAKAVYLFFIMSGFVLFLPYRKAEGSNPYKIFLVKRVARIYLPYLCALFLAAGADLLFYRPVPGHYATMTWGRPFQLNQFFQHVLFLGVYPPHRFNFAFWSLVQEMRISLIYPVIALVAKRASLRGAVLSGLLFVFAGAFGDVHLPFWGWLTISCAGMFLIGAAIAKHLDKIVSYCHNRGALFRALLFGICLIFLWTSDLAPTSIRRMVWTLPCHVLGVALLLALVFSTEQLRNLLITPAVRWLGKISYSLYLLHGTVLYSLYCVFWPSGNHVAVLSVGVLLSLTLSAVFYRWVEVPSMQIGRDVGGALQRSKETPVLQAS